MANRFLARCVCLLLLLFAPATATAAVEIRFHSKDFGSSFPHAFIVLNGTLDATGEPVHGNYGFTLRHAIGPSVLFRPVEGTIGSETAGYVAISNRHFSVTLTDAQYRQVMQLIERWRALPQPSYRLDQRNCVSFVAEVATLLGLTAEPAGLMRRPRAFLERVRARNLARLAPSAGASTASATR